MYRRLGVLSRAGIKAAPSVWQNRGNDAALSFRKQNITGSGRSWYGPCDAADALSQEIRRCAVWTMANPSKIKGKTNGPGSKRVNLELLERRR